MSFNALAITVAQQQHLFHFFARFFFERAVVEIKNEPDSRQVPAHVENSGEKPTGYKGIQDVCVASAALVYEGEVGDEDEDPEEAFEELDLDGDDYCLQAGQFFVFLLR